MGTNSYSTHIFLFLAIATSAWSSFALEIVGHRGASFDAPENTLASMKLAWVQKADGIETDIHLSKDGEMVVMHDPDTKRLTGKEGKIVEQTWAELKSLSVGKWKSPAFAEETIPTLESIFATIPEGKCIFTEIKIHDVAILDKLEKAMKASGKTEQQLRIITFYYDMAKAAKSRFPKHPVYFLHDWKKDKEGRFPNLDTLIKMAKEANLDGLDLNSRFPIDKAFVAKVHAAGLKLYTWTVDDPEVANAERDAGVDGITTNRPQFLREKLAEK